jgi:two-component system, chemotaxis family, protein-glutamate methylesterase/glutaminase
MPWNNNGVARPSSPRLARRVPINTEGVKRDVIVIGASAGGVMALEELFAALPQRLPAFIGVALHRSTSPGELVTVLARRSRLPIVEPKDSSPIKPGVIYLAPADHHLLFDHAHVAAHRGPKEHSTRPAVDPLFRSAAAHYGKRVVGILLTGAGEDGVSGLVAISQASGLTLTQDPDDAYMPYMPINAMRFDDVAAVFPLRDMAAVVTALVKGHSVAPGEKSRVQ